MPELKVKTITPVAEKWLEECSSSRVLNIFEAVCNLINASGNALSLVTRQDDLGPFSVLLETIDSNEISGLDFRNHITLLTPILMNDQHFQLGSLRIATIGRVSWDPSLDWKQLKSVRLTATLGLIRDHLKVTAPDDSLVSPILLGISCARHHEHVQYIWNGMKEDLSDENGDSWKEAAQGLAGLGPGLTPAGDDFLMGLIYRIWLEKEEEQADSLISEIVRVAGPKTNTLSRALIQAAGRKEASYPWHRLHRAILDGQSSYIIITLNRILAIGHTSGADALAGFLAID